MSRGSRTSDWEVLRRCLIIIRCLQRGPHTRDELIAAIRQESSDAYDELPDGPKLHKRFRNDLARLRDNLQIDITYDRRLQRYILQASEAPLLDLPDDNLETLSWLAETFQPQAPYYEQIHSLVTQLRSYLAPDRRQQMDQYHHSLKMTLARRDDDKINPTIRAKLERALKRRQRVELVYLSSNSDIPKRHIVEVYTPPYFDTERGHYYLEGYCLEIKGDGWEKITENYIQYRLGRIQAVTPLPNRIQPTPPRRKKYAVQYWLSPTIARVGVSERRWIEQESIEIGPRGVIVSGWTHNVFFAVQELMHYRHHCKILGGNEMERQMKETVEKMAELYKTDPSAHSCG